MQQTQFVLHLTMLQGSEGAPFRSRQEEDDVCGRVIVCVVAYACRLLSAASLRQFLLSNVLHAQDALEISDAQPKSALQVSPFIFPPFFPALFSRPFPASPSAQLLLDSRIGNVLCIPSPSAPLICVPDVPPHPPLTTITLLCIKRISCAGTHPPAWQTL
jgi:hypothetical protein